MAELDASRVQLIQMAKELAELGTGSGPSAGNEDRYLERFRAIYDHLAATVFTTSGVGANRRGDASIPGWD